jgi:predicted nuclease of predicted toxin-antitoxin system
MKFVIDMNLSPAWTAEFTNAGWEAVHWSVIGDVTALDSEILSWALAANAIVLTQDLDF